MMVYIFIVLAALILWLISSLLFEAVGGLAIKIINRLKNILED